MINAKGQFTHDPRPEKRTGKYLNCKYCNKVVYIPQNRLKTFGFCSKSCSSKFYGTERLRGTLTEESRRKISETLKGKMAGEKHYNWKGGKQKHGDGYIQIYKPNHPSSDSRGRVLEHRYLIEIKLGRVLEKWEDVHHINGNKSDNRLENLEVLNNKDHGKLEWKLGKREKSRNTWFKKGQIPWNKSYA